MITISETEYNALIQRLSERDALIAALRKELEESEFLVATLKKKIDTLENDIICNLQETVESLAEDNKRLNQTNKRLNAANNNIRTVPDKEKNRTGKVGRPPGQKPTINRRPEHIDREEVIDIQACPKGHPLSKKITGIIEKVVKVIRITTENVKYIKIRRHCRICKKQFCNEPPNVAPYSRVSANFSAVPTALNMAGLSLGKATNFCNDALKGNISRSWTYRNKINASRILAPEHQHISEQILDEPYLQSDELWWKIPEVNGAKVMVARGSKFCLAKVVKSANIGAVKEFLPEYAGIVGQDSNTIWLHAGNDHQMCMQHQRRLSKKDLTYRNLQGDPLSFVTALHHLDYMHHVYDKIEDSHTRMLAARCLEKQRSELLNGTYGDDESGTIERRKKRHLREGFFMTTHMYQGMVKSDNNAVENVNRQFASIRGDGGGNRTQRGMDANSILFTIMATDWINKKSFFDHLVRAASGDG